ncbi:hypothetical protein P3G55_17635 [Leptospira sp. 96542]|nr:hypothetical protein [Leptospira sp. 96542]
MKKPIKPKSEPQTLMLAYLCVKDLENLSDKVKILDRFGLPDIDIVTICDAASGSVRNARLQKKQKNKSI